MSFGRDQKKAQRYGKYHGSIDFELNEKINANVYNNKQMKPVVGKLYIGNKAFKVTWQELDLIAETCELAKESYNRAYRMGQFGKLR